MSGTTPPPGPPAGWYPHPTMADTQAYWDGEGWTNHVAPAARTTPAPTHRPPAVDFTNLWHAGWVTALLLPIVGFVIGIVLCTKPGMAGKGVGVMIVALIAAGFWAAVLA